MNMKQAYSEPFFFNYIALIKSYHVVFILKLVNFLICLFVKFLTLFDLSFFISSVCSHDEEECVSIFSIFCA